MYQTFSEKVVFLTPWYTHVTCAYQGVRNVTFSENFANVLNELPLVTVTNGTLRPYRQLIPWYLSLLMRISKIWTTNKYYADWKDNKIKIPFSKNPTKKVCFKELAILSLENLVHSSFSNDQVLFTICRKKVAGFSCMGYITK